MSSDLRLLACAAGLALLAASAPEPLSLQTPDGAAVEVARQPDEALVVHFWASWCPDCAGELPVLDREARACGPASHVRVVAVNAGESAEQARSFLAEHGVSLPLLLDAGGRAWRRAGLRGVPSNLVWTRDGVQRSEGPWNAERWRDQLAALGCAPT